MLVPVTLFLSWTACVRLEIKSNDRCDLLHVALKLSLDTTQTTWLKLIYSRARSLIVDKIAYWPLFMIAYLTAYEVFNEILLSFANET